MSTSEPVLKLRYRGLRFENGSIPLTSLSELGAFQKAIDLLYRAEFLERNSNRSRVRKSYQKDLVLSLNAIERGSAVACLEPPQHREQKLDDDLYNPLHACLKKFMDFLENGQTTDGSKDVFAQCIRSVGSSLHDDETIDFVHAGRTISYDQNKRKQLLSGLASSYSRTDEAVFAVFEYDKKNQSFEVCSPSDERCKIDFRNLPELGKVAFRAFEGYEGSERNVKILISGEFTYDRRGSLASIAPESFELLGERDLRWRIPYLRHRNQEDSDAQQILTEFEKLWVEHLQGLGFEHPYLYLIDSETISAEWVYGGTETSMLLRDETLSLSNSVDDKEFPLNQAKDAAHWIASHLLSLESST